MFWELLAKNPFGSLREHMKKTQICVDKTKDMFKALFDGNKEQVKILAKEISKVEHECDIIKQNIHIMVSQSVFLPIEKRDLLEVISYMDDIADSAEDLGVLLTMRWMEMPLELKDSFQELLNKTYDVVDESAKVIFAIDRLLEAGFSGPDAEEVLQLINVVDKLEHEADKAQDQFGKKLFALENQFSAASLIMWIKIVDKVRHLSNSSEKMTSHIRLMLVIQ